MGRFHNDSSLLFLLGLSDQNCTQWAKRCFVTFFTIVRFETSWLLRTVFCLYGENYFIVLPGICIFFWMICSLLCCYLALWIRAASSFFSRLKTFLSHLSTHCGARTHDPKIKTGTLYRLSQPGAPTSPIFQLLAPVSSSYLSELHLVEILSISELRAN